MSAQYYVFAHEDTGDLQPQVSKFAARDVALLVPENTPAQHVAVLAWEGIDPALWQLHIPSGLLTLRDPDDVQLLADAKTRLLRLLVLTMRAHEDRRHMRNLREAVLQICTALSVTGEAVDRLQAVEDANAGLRDLYADVLVAPALEDLESVTWSRTDPETP